MRSNHCRWMIACCACVLTWNPLAFCGDSELVPASSKSKPSVEVAEVREFEVRVDNYPRGTHRLTIKSDAQSHKVEMQTDVKVDVIVYAYVFKLRGTEIWRDGRVEETDIQCEDGGKKRSFSLKSDGPIQQVSFNGKPSPRTPPILMSTAYWKLPPSDQHDKSFQIVDVDTGTIKGARFHLVGTDSVTVGSRTIACKQFKIDGPSPADLWFDDQNCLVRQKSIEEGHAMELRLKQIRTLKDEDPGTSN